MLSNRLGILGVLVMLFAMPQVSSGPIAPLKTTQISPRRHSPMRFHGLRPDRTINSENWSGYAATGSSFTQARGSWIVPTVNCNATPNAYASFWVGLDGYSSSTVEQIGTDSDCANGKPSYYAWYEFYPENAYYAGNLTSLKPGDKMSATVTYNTTTGKFTVTITDETEPGLAFTTTFTPSGRTGAPKRSSAEWIAEAPCCSQNGGILPLSDFGTVSLGADYTSLSGTNDATDSSTSGPIGRFGSSVEAVTMVSSEGVDEAVPSSLTGDGTSFTVAWESEGSEETHTRGQR